MRFSNLALLAGAGMAAAQRPSNTSVCDYYTTALLKENNATNQYTLLTLLVNTAVIGNYTKPNVGIMVPGILAPGMYNGTAVNLLPYFDGMFESSNRGGSAGVSVNFLDDGGAVPLMMNMPSNTTTSNQYLLLTHLYQYFGYLLGCSEYGMTGFPAYSGHGGQYNVHKFMDLSIYEVSYFIQQVGLSAASFGVAAEDVTAVGTALMNYFGYRCAAPVTIIPTLGSQTQSICIDSSCPIAPNASCSLYANNITMPATNATFNMTTMSNASSSSGSKPAQQTTNAGNAVVAQMALAAVGVAGAFFL